MLLWCGLSEFLDTKVISCLSVVKLICLRRQYSLDTLPLSADKEKYIVIFHSAHFKLDLIIKDVHRHLADILCIHYIQHTTVIQIRAKDIDKKLEAYFKSQIFGFLTN